MNDIPVCKIARIRNFVFIVTDPMVERVVLLDDSGLVGTTSLLALQPGEDPDDAYILASVTDLDTLLIHGGCPFEFDVTVVGVNPESDRVSEVVIEDAINTLLRGLGHNEYGDIICPDCGHNLHAHVSMVHYRVPLHRDINPNTNVAYEEILYDDSEYDDSESNIIYTSVGCPQCGWRAMDNVC